LIDAAFGANSSTSEQITAALNAPKRQAYRNDQSSELPTRCRKLEMQGGVLGKHAPANANTLITIRAAIINSLPFAACLDEA
jgi:hypothetical protein